MCVKCFRQVRSPDEALKNKSIAPIQFWTFFNAHLKYGYILMSGLITYFRQIDLQLNNCSSYARALEIFNYFKDSLPYSVDLNTRKTTKYPGSTEKSCHG